MTDVFCDCVLDELCRWKGTAKYPILGEYYRIRQCGSYLQYIDVNDSKDFAETNCWRFDEFIHGDKDDTHFKFRGAIDTWDLNLSKYVPNYVYLKTWELHLLQKVDDDENSHVEEVDRSDGTRWLVRYTD